MNEYTPDRWVLLKMETPEETFYRILAGWHGSFSWGESWKLSSGVETFEDRDTLYTSEQTSGSIYHCLKKSEGMSSYMFTVLKGLQRQAIEAGCDISLIDAEAYMLGKL